MKIKTNGFAILVFTAGVLAGCESSLEQDAQKLADYQCKHAENLLTGKVRNNKQLAELNPEASKFYDEMMLKYSSESQYKKFDKAVSAAMEDCDFFAQRKEPKNKISRREEAKIASLSPEAQQYIENIKYDLEFINRSHVAQKSVVKIGYIGKNFALLLDQIDKSQFKGFIRNRMPEKAEEIIQKGLQQAEEMQQYLNNEGIKQIHYVDEKTQNVVTYDLSEKKVTLTNEKSGEEKVYKVDLQTVRENEAKAGIRHGFSIEQPLTRSNDKIV